MKEFSKYSIFILLLVILFSACRAKEVYIPVESVKREYVDKILHDSVFRHDSVLVRTAGDTVFFERYRYLYRNRLVRDSVFVCDSIRVPYPVEGETRYENCSSWWQRLLMAMGLIGFGWVGFRFYRFFRG